MCTAGLPAIPVFLYLVVKVTIRIVHFVLVLAADESRRASKHQIIFRKTTILLQQLSDSLLQAALVTSLPTAWLSKRMEAVLAPSGYRGNSEVELGGSKAGSLCWVLLESQLESEMKESLLNLHDFIPLNDEDYG